jgi:rare lipoprotein A (peptidoglycan hydrolase)
VTDPRSKRSVVVVVNDRGPFTKGRVLDLSLAAAKALNMTGRGLLNVTAVVEPKRHDGDRDALIALIEGVQRIQISCAEAGSPSRVCTVFSFNKVMEMVSPAPGSGIGTAYENQCRL